MRTTAIITYQYDSLYRMTEKVRTWNETLTMRESYEFADGDASVYASTRIDEFTSTVGATSNSYTYTYDSFGNIQTITDSAGLITRYYYDDQQQLIRENNPYTNTTYVYTYDRGGNRTSQTTYDKYISGSLTGESGTTVNYVYSGDRLMSYGTSNLTYDDLGNPLTYGTFTYTWQNGRQLARVGYTGSSTEYLYEYNDSGIRTSKTVNGVKHTYTLNGSQIVTESWTQSGVEYFIVYLYDESGAPIGMQYRTSNYAWGIFDNFFFEKNLFGDIVAVYNESGIKVISYTYDAWGNHEPNELNIVGSNAAARYNPFRYRGYYYDTETGFYYLQSRYYDPVTGRFLNADSYISTGTGLLGFNMYTYCNNNPVLSCDCTGECVHNGVAYGMGKDCPNCLAGITDPEYEKIPAPEEAQPFDSQAFDQQWIENRNNSTLESDNGFSLAQNVTNGTLTTFTILLGLIPDTTWALSPVGYMITTPVAITFHAMNPNLDGNEKAVMIGYELVVAAGGICMAYGIANVWNPTGWAACTVAVIIPIAYTGVTVAVGSIMQTRFETN